MEKVEWLKSQSLDITEVGEYAQFWLGATTDVRFLLASLLCLMFALQGRHDPDHNQGVWTWPHKGSEVGWFDWADGEPNDYHNENCLVLHEYHDPFFPWVGLTQILSFINFYFRLVITSGMILAATSPLIIFVRRSANLFDAFYSS